NSTNGFTSSNVQSAIEELSANINTNKGDLSLETGVLEFLDNTNGTNKLLASAKVGIVNGAITTSKLNDKAVTSDKMGAAVDGSEEGMVPVASADGTVIYKKIGVSNIDAKNLTTDGIIVVGDATSSTTSAASTLLAAAKLSVKDESITTAQIQNGTIKPEDIAIANKDQVLVTNASGNPIWVDQSTIATKVEANNGLKLGTDAHAGKVQLGGELIRKTTITTTADHTLAIAGLDKKKVQATDATDGITQHLLAVGSDNVVKALKAAMPKFFYMPSVMVPTAESQATQEGVTYNNTSRTGTINLYTIYKKQFGSPVMSSAGASPLPVLPASELGFHVTYATEGVFTIKSITEEGLMTYGVSSTANINVGSFINIVFSVKED
ncbi:collagen, type VII, alpha, partial [Sphingobacterium nematocida]